MKGYICFFALIITFLSFKGECGQDDNLKYIAIVHQRILHQPVAVSKQLGMNIDNNLVSFFQLIDTARDLQKFNAKIFQDKQIASIDRAKIVKNIILSYEEIFKRIIPYISVFSPKSIIARDSVSDFLDSNSNIKITKDLIWFSAVLLAYETLYVSDKTFLKVSGIKNSFYKIKREFAVDAINFENILLSSKKRKMRRIITDAMTKLIKRSREMDYVKMLSRLNLESWDPHNQFLLNHILSNKVVNVVAFNRKDEKVGPTVDEEYLGIVLQISDDDAKLVDNYKEKVGKRQNKWWKLVLMGVGLSPIEFLVSTTIHEGSHALMAKGVLDAQIVSFTPYPHMSDYGFRFGGMSYLYDPTKWTAGKSALVSAAPMFSDVVILGAYGGLVLSGSMPKNKYAQMAMLVFAAGHWVDLVNHIVARNEHTDTRKLESFLQDEHDLSKGWARTIVRGSQSLAVLAGGYFLVRGGMKIFGKNKAGTSKEDKTNDKKRLGAFSLSPIVSSDFYGFSFSGRFY